MDTLSVSVAMCTYNGAQFLEVQLESIAGQYRLPDEVVVCDDGSTDDTVDIVRGFVRSARFPVRFEINKINLGSTKNFEKSISLCRGNVVVLADQDDAWYRHKLQRLETAFIESSETIAAFSDADLIDENGKVLGRRLWPTFSFGIREQMRFANGQALNVLMKHPVVTGATMAFRRTLFDRIAPIPANEIHDRWLAFLLAASGRFAVISEPLMQYRQHQTQQLGPGPLTLREQTAHARRSTTKSYLEQIERFQQLSELVRKESNSLLHASRIQKEIQRKICHLEQRARLPRARVARIPRVAAEVLKGAYWRYSSGWKSVAKDLLLRSDEPRDGTNNSAV